MRKRTHLKAACGAGGALLLVLIVAGPALLLLSCRPARPRWPLAYPPAPPAVAEPLLIRVQLARSDGQLLAGG